MAARWMPKLGPPVSGPHKRILVGLLGQGISGSRTPMMHMSEGKAQGLDYDYRLIDLAGCTPEPAIEEILCALEDAGFRGLNVTFPYKQAVIPYLGSLSENARAVGAVNTIVLRDGVRHGHNTDYWGFGESFRRGLPGVERDAVLLIGAGGAGGAVASALLGEGVGRLMIRDTNLSAAQRLASSLAGRFGADRVDVVDDLAAATAQADGIVNASPVGMANLPGTPLPTDLIEPRHWVADIVYFPLETELLGAARANGCKVLPGAGMAVFQAVRAFGLFTGLPADPDRMRKAFDRFETEVAK